MNRMRMGLVAFMLLVAVALAGSCVPPSTITSSDSLSTIFDQAAITVQYQNTIFDYLADPTSDNLRIYITTQGRFFIPIWSAAGVTFFLLMACCLQLCCFSCCGRQ